MRAVPWFFAGRIVGDAAILFGWIACADLFDVGDMDGGEIMGVGFALAPAGAVAIGIVPAVAFGGRWPPGSGRAAARLTREEIETRPRRPSVAPPGAALA